MKKAVAKVVVCITVDVEDSDLESLLKIKEVCQKYNAPITWFVEPAQCNQPEALDLLKKFIKEGDEIGLHIHWSGSYHSGIRSAQIEGVRIELEQAMESLAPRFHPTSFRGGGLCQMTPVLKILEQTGFEFDSSVAYNLDEPAGWHQGHENIRPVSAYYPDRKSYDIITYDDSERMNILEIPVTRGIPSTKLWHNMLEPGVTSFYLMKLIFTQYFKRRHFQPLVLLVSILHSWTWRRYPNTLGDLDKFLNYVSNREVQFNTIRQAGNDWKTIWGACPKARNALLSEHFAFRLKTRIEVDFIKLALFIGNLKINLFRLKAYVSKFLEII